jgi:hypothetical protein
MRNLVAARQKSATNVPPVLPYIIFLLSIAGIACWFYLIYYLIFVFQMPPEFPYKTLSWIANISRRVAFLSVSVSGIYILLKAKYTKATMFFTLFFTFYSLYTAVAYLFVNGLLPSKWWIFNDYLMYPLTVILAIRTFQEFPSHLTAPQIRLDFKGRYIQKPFIAVLAWLVKGYRIWLVFFPLGLLLIEFSILISYTIICVVVCIGYLLVQLRVSNDHAKKPLYWLMWYAFILIIHEILYYYFIWLKGQASSVALGCNVLLNFSLLFTVVMIVFFSDLLNAKLFLQKTIIFGVFVFIFLFAFSFLEHFVVHWLAEFLQIHNIYVASTFACIMGMFFQPMKKRLKIWMKFSDDKAKHLPAKASGS